MNRLLESLESRMLLAAPTLALDGGSSAAAATNLGRISGKLIVQDQLAVGETADYFQFTVRSTGNVNLVLSGLTSDANLILYSSSGQTLGSSGRTGTRSDAIGLSLKGGTYAFGITRRWGRVQTPYSISVQADLNYQAASVDGETYTLGLIRADRTAAPIDASRETWVVIHGWLGSPASVHSLATAIDAASRHNQVLELDWSAPAADSNTVTAISRVPDVAAWAAGKLASWGIPGSLLNLVGHSMGGYMTDQIAKRMSGGADRVVALDPATPSLGGIDFSGTDFDAHSQYSLAFVGSDFSTPAAAWSADETIKLDVGNWSNITTHMAVLSLFTGITQKNNTSNPGTISPLFSLRSLRDGSRPGFTGDAIDGEYEAILTGRSSNGQWVPAALTYRSQRLGKFVTVTA